MQDGEATLAWVLFWIFATITTVATYLITDFHRSRGLAVGLTALSMALFIGLYFALQAFIRFLGL